MGLPATAIGETSVAHELVGRGRESSAALGSAAQRLSDLAVEATELDERAGAIAARERELEALAATLADEQARHLQRGADLDQLERALERRAVAVSEQESIVASREAVTRELAAELHEQARALEERAARFHWRWLLRAWAWRPRRAKDARLCELFFTPSPSGYKLLPQTGVAVAPGARITGLLGEHTTYVVTRLAQLPFDGRWCAYLEVDDFRGGESR